MSKELIYGTPLGKMYCGDSLDFMRGMEPESVDLVVTSPPYALHFKKEYGNIDQEGYINWFLPFAAEIRRVLKPNGSFVLNVGGVWTPGHPTRSLYHYRLLLALCDELDYKLAQEFFWYNPAKVPAPAEWVNVQRIRVKDAVEYVFWLSPTERPKADNTKVLLPYSKDMERLIKRGLRETKRPSGHTIKKSWAEDRGGAIPPNMIKVGNNESGSSYIKESKRLGKKIHPARYPAEIPRFFVEFLTDAGDLVLDPFAGSNTTGAVAEKLGRRWIGVEQRREYAEDSELRFREPQPEPEAEDASPQSKLL